MATIKCSGCGANISLDGTKRSVKCAYCGTTYTDDKYVEPKPSLFGSNISVSVQPQSAVTTGNNINGRPKVNVGIFCLLFFILGWIPGVIYLAIVNSKQKEWDARNNRR